MSPCSIIITDILYRSGFIWQIDKGKGRWKTVNNSLIEVLEQAYQSKEIDIKEKNFVVNSLLHITSIHNIFIIIIIILLCVIICLK